MLKKAGGSHNPHFKIQEGGGGCDRKIYWFITKQDVSNSAAINETQFSHTEVWCIFINYLSISKGRAGGEYFETVFLLYKLTE